MTQQEIRGNEISWKQRRGNWPRHSSSSVGKIRNLWVKVLITAIYNLQLLRGHAQLVLSSRVGSSLLGHISDKLEAETTDLTDVSEQVTWCVISAAFFYIMHFKCVVDFFLNVVLFCILCFLVLMGLSCVSFCCCFFLFWTTLKNTWWVWNLSHVHICAAVTSNLQAGWPLISGLTNLLLSAHQVRWSPCLMSRLWGPQPWGPQSAFAADPDVSRSRCFAWPPTDCCILPA